MRNSWFGRWGHFVLLFVCLAATLNQFIHGNWVGILGWCLLFSCSFGLSLAQVLHPDDGYW